MGMILHEKQDLCRENKAFEGKTLLFLYSFGGQSEKYYFFSVSSACCSASRLTKRKVKYIFVGKENISPKAIQTALIIIPVTPKDSIYSLKLCK